MPAAAGAALELRRAVLTAGENAPDRRPLAGHDVQAVAGDLDRCVGVGAHRDVWKRRKTREGQRAGSREHARIRIESHEMLPSMPARTAPDACDRATWFPRSPAIRPAW